MKIDNKIIRLKRFSKSICHCERSVAILFAMTIILSLFIIAVPMAGTVEADDGYEISLEAVTPDTGISKDSGTGISKTLGLRTNFWVGQIHEWAYDNTFDDPSMDNFYLDKPLASEYAEWSESTWHGLVNEDGSYAQAYGDPVYPARMTGDNEARFHVTSNFNNPASDFSFDIVIVTSTGDIVNSVTNCAYNKTEGTWTITSRPYEGSGLEVQPLMETFVGPDEFYISIQNGIDGVAEGGTINVAAGTYEEAFTIDKSLTLQGPKSGVDAKFRTVDTTEAVIDPNDSSAGAEKSWVIRPRASDVTIDGFTIQNPILVYGSAGLIDITGAWDNIQIINNILQQPGVSTSASTNWGKFGINVEGASNILIENNYFKDILCDTATPWNGTSAIWPSGSSNIEILNNKIENATSFGVGLSGSNNSVTIMGNEITLGIQSGTAEPSIRTAGIRIGADNDNITIEGNLIYNCTGTTGAPAAGITIQNEGINNITNNQIMDNIYGVNIVETAIVSTTTINDNEIKGNTEYGILNNTTNPVDAIHNWWGHTSGPTHADNPGGTGDAVSDNVDYYPWYIDEEQTTLFNAITLTKTGPTTANKGNDIPYTITYKNKGPIEVTNIVITEDYPPEVEYVSATPEPDTGTNNQWTIGTLAPGGEDTISVTVHLK